MKYDEAFTELDFWKLLKLNYKLDFWNHQAWWQPRSGFNGIFFC